MQLNKKLSLIFIPLLSLTLLSACKGINIADTQKVKPIKTLVINNYKVECTSLRIDLCLQLKVKGSRNWEEYAADIKNFTYDWGYDYELEVTYEDISPTPEDRPKREYTLSKLIAKTKAPDTDLFKLTVSRDKTANLIKKSSTTDSVYRIYNEIDVRCDPEVECTTLKENITQDNAIKFILSHNSDLNNPLDISSIACSSARSSFKTDCK